MDRRSWLGVLGTGALISLSGCVTGMLSDEENSPDPPDGIADVRFERKDPQGWELIDPQKEVHTGFKIIDDKDADHPTFIVRGQVESGDPDCTEIHIDGIEYIDTTVSIEIEVREEGEECLDVIAFEPFEMEIVFETEDDVPESIEINDFEKGVPEPE
ncbi:hypothetical protein [Halalkalicoccus tibetensis]|uniref:Lipoprotein n=1 Tax=Halalkalicoccus tibetensis TaxID=175632 RepID=A0ABD5V379_9EURY